jgi:hypothetical protein
MQQCYNDFFKFTNWVCEIAGWVVYARGLYLSVETSEMPQFIAAAAENATCKVHQLQPSTTFYTIECMHCTMASLAIDKPPIARDNGKRDNNKTCAPYVTLSLIHAVGLENSFTARAWPHSQFLGRHTFCAFVR